MRDPRIELFILGRRITSKQKKEEEGEYLSKNVKE